MSGHAAFGNTVTGGAGPVVIDGRARRREGY